MADSMYTIDLDVSRALAAQQKLLDGWAKIASQSSNVGKALEPLKTSFNDANDAVSNLTQKSIGNLVRRLNEVLGVSRQMKEALYFSNNDLVGFDALDKSLTRIRTNLREVAKDFAKDINPKFNVQSVAQFEDAIAKVQGRLNTLQYFKSSMNPIDFSNFERAYNTAIIGYEQSLEKMRNTSKAILAQSGKDWDLVINRTQKDFSSGMLSGMSKYQSIGSIIDTKPIEEATTKLTGFGLVVKRVFEYGVVYRFQNALLSLPGTLYNTSAAMDKLQASYEGIFQNKASNEFQYAYDAAQKYGKSIESLGDSYKKFSVTADYLGMTQKNIRGIFESITQALTKVGGSSSDVQNAFRAVEQMLSKGTVSAEEFRRQFAQYIPGAMKMGADAVGKTTAEFMKMMKNGELVSTDFLPKFAEKLEEFSKGWENAAGTIESNTERMYNSLKKFSDDKGITAFFKEVMKSAADAANQLNIGEEIKSKQKELQKLQSYGIVSNEYVANANADTSEYGGDFIYQSKLKYEQLTKAIQEANAAKEEYINGLESEFRKAVVAMDDMGKTGAAGIGEATAKAQELANKLYDLTGKTHSINIVTLVDTSQLDSAMAKVDSLIKNTTYAKAELLKTKKASIETESVNLSSGIQKLESDLKNLQDADEKDKFSLVQKLNEAKGKAEGLTEALQDVNQAIKDTASTRATKQFDASDPLRGITTGTNDKGMAKEAALRDFYRNTIKNGLWDQINSENDQEKKLATEHFANLYKDYLGDIDKINKRGRKSNSGAQRAAIANDKFGESLDNLLKKQFAIAEENPLEAMFASIDEKANSLSHRLDLLGIKSKEGLENAAKEIQQYVDVAKNNAVGKELEKLFPWMKKDNQITAIWTLLTSEWERAAKEADKLGVSGDELRNMLLNLAKATETATKEAQLLSKATSATNFEDYINAMKELENVKNSPEGSNTKAAIQDFGGVYITLSREMQNSRIEMYRKVAEQAIASGMSEEQAAAMVAAKWQESEVARLEAVQKYGTASEAFNARLQQNFETYKDAATKSREQAVKWADSISDAADSFSSGVAQSIGDLIRNVGNGTASIENLWKNMLSRMLDMLASFIEQAVKSWMKDLIGGMLSNDGSSNSFDLSGLFKGAFSSSSTGSSPAYDASSLKIFGDSAGNSMSDSFFKSLSSNSDSSKVVIGNTSVLEDSFSNALKTSNVWNASSYFNNGNFSTWKNGSFSSSTPNASSGYSWGGAAAGLGVAAGGVMGMINAKSALSALGSGVMTAGGIMMMIPGMQVAGAVTAAVGGLVSLFGEENKKEVKKVASGYNVMYSGGKTVTSGVDFYNNGGIVGTGVGDPAVTKKISDAFKEAAENLHDFADNLGFAANVLDNFSMPAMNITSDQLDTYIKNGTNAMAFQALENAGLRGAFDMLAEDGEVYIDEVQRLSDAFSTGSSKLAAYGYNMVDVAKVTDDQIAVMREQTIETAAGTSQAIMTMAQSMGATSDQLAQLAENASDGSQALSVTNEQLSNLAVADWVSKVEDKVGGEDAFNSIMDNLLKNVFDSIGAYAENLGYYNQMASKYITQLGDDSITVDNFWDKFNTALKNGLDPDQFEVWAKASDWVNSIDSVNDALDKWNEGMLQLNQSLDARSQKARGLDYEASITSQLASAEKELYDAREAGYDATYIARLQEIQALELQALIIQHQEDYAKEMLDATKRYATVIEDNTTLYKIQMEENAQELSDLAKTYNWSVGSAEEGLFQAVQRAQWAELIKTIQDTASAVATATANMKSDLATRQAILAGYDEEAEAIQKVKAYTDELNKAYSDGIDPSLISELQKTQMDELAKYWSDTISKMKTDITDLYAKQQNLVGTLSGNTQTAIQNLYSLFTRYQAGETGLADSIISSLQSIASAVKSMVDSINDTIASIRTGSDTSTTTADVSAATAKNYFDTQVSKAAAGDTNAMSNVTNYATQYLSALKSSTADSSVYGSGVDYVISALSKLSSGASSSSSGLSDIATQVTNDQIAEAEKALKQAEVAQLKTTYDTLMAQAVEAFKGSSYGSLVQQMATTGVGWSGGINNLLASDYWEGGTNSMRAADAIIAGQGGMTASSFVGWFLNNYGTGTGYVDWNGALTQWITQSKSIWPSFSPASSDIMEIYNQAQDAYAQWQILKTQYGFAVGGVITGGSTYGDSNLVFANSGERILTSQQNEAFEKLAFGSWQSDLISSLISRIEELAQEVIDLRRSNTEENRAMVNFLQKIHRLEDEWDVNGLPETRTVA